MKVLLTGASGFLGSHFCSTSNDELITLGSSKVNMIRCNISTFIPELPKVEKVIHCAGLAHIPAKKHLDSDLFHQVNYLGTANILKNFSDRNCFPKLFIFISSVSVYGLQSGLLINEDSPTNGINQYAKSKILAEREVLDWGKRNGVKIFIFRLPLIVGENAPGNLGSLVTAIKKGYYFRVGDGKACKSMVLAEDVAKFVSSLSEEMPEGIYNLTDDFDPNLSQFDTVISQKYNKKVRSLPLSFLSILSKIGDYVPFIPFDSYKLDKLNSTLTFDCAKAKKFLGWSPNSVIKWFRVK
jgi:nucleoside-diphosphate-sugar epimerase